ncbi:TIGR01548 family HAD-type hydrolase [Nodularia spumigena]|uniref:TIGR01548 family HAD-type hydrolase n=1 Tax=Nodularia spumigena TaxID=70799 RepID=UPI00232DC6D1|nr:TIGR01548 family HAD-type hydrolase [Nodularia spumigena]MDB9354778.1 TIGR01548 family HAD-type hydrolase [Nodularia spumigena CS-587/03]MDB9305519.1 TIGR01548 family HAD-type hydrolase [Nodularia spumigena CS-591/12]MDB9341019.1 TIGR01548 family HAD-type hydrolase [Nodularia spumigena CS-589/07]MDB9497346.1 TIGR01548 family HAD-type hydrolase [Nodularia spumigena CS-336/02]MDB9533403.1 TIGR01548 family HAD-type hydrolase [Nodularia spumigena CS-1038]
MTEKSSLNPIVIFDIDGVVRDVGNSYRRALADTVEHFTNTAYRPTPVDIDQLKSEGLWNNDWEASQEFIYRNFETLGQTRQQLQLDYNAIVAFFQSRYRGTDPENWNGYICDEPLLLQPSYLENLTASGIYWGFFSGATRGSATYVLHKRLGLQSPVLIAMEDAPGKPDPTGLFATIDQLENELNKMSTIIYVGDTVADMYTVRKARETHPHRNWIGVGILPPHVQETAAHSHAYSQTLLAAGAAIVLSNVEQLNPVKVQELLQGMGIRG